MLKKKILDKNTGKTVKRDLEWLTSESANLRDHQKKALNEVLEHQEADKKRSELPPLDLRTSTIKLVGDSSLISHAWSTKAKQEMLDKQMKKAKQAKSAKNPFQDFCESLYWVEGIPHSPGKHDVENGEFGFPAVAFKASAVNACSHVSNITKVQARGAFHIDGELVRINGEPTMREDMVRIAMGTADIRHRGEFKDWSVEFEVRYNASVISIEQIRHLFNVAGFAIGVGEWRPQTNGSFGMFHVE